MRRKEARIIDQVESWCCSRCARWLPREDYHPDKRTPNGLKAQCKSCHSEGAIGTRDKTRHADARREGMRRARASDPEKHRARDREASRQREWSPQREARYQLNLAVRRGDVTKPDRCGRCAKPKKLTAHHDDYSKPLAVRWLCHQCHGLEHRS